MPPRNNLWTDVTLSEHPHERVALNFIRDGFPDREPFRAWSNFTFQADDGSLNEVDLLVVSPTGVYLVEIKSHPGRIGGDAGTWTWFPPDGRAERRFDNPLLLAERKAKKLKSLLARQPALRSMHGRGPDFYLSAVVFLSDPNLRVALAPEAKQKVFGPDSEDPGQPNRLPGILRLFKSPDPRWGRKVDRPLSTAISRAMEEAGIRESVSLRTVGQYRLGDLLDEGDGWQDYEAVHPQLKKERRRVRIYLTDRAASEEEREAQVRAATREFRILRDLVHPGIERPLELVPAERGPALIFAWDPEAERLDHWLRKNESTLGSYERLTLLRGLGELVREAHRRGIYHRALSPRTVRVVERKGKPEIRIGDWQTASRITTTTTMSTTLLGTVHVAGQVARPEQLYLAPEIATVADAEALPADIFSLGALAVLILSGKPPAEDLDGMRSLLHEHGSLSLSDAMSAPDRELEKLVAEATRAEAHRRFLSVDEFLDQLDYALEAMTRPPVIDPLEVQKGEILEGGRTVVRRVGSGSTSLVLVVRTEDGIDEALKIARSEDHADRLRAEYAVLSRLRDRTIVEAFGLLNIGGRTALRLEVAHATLGDMIRKEGRLSLDLLVRFGSDLVDAVAYLEHMGVWHRDIKPDNLGIAERGKQRERRLVLMDFSLAGADPGALQVGTRGYLDPFLTDRPQPRWDEQAERYAVGVTLYEMATGTRPTWGDGSTDPSLAGDELPNIDESLFDPAVRGPLTDFFRRALHRDPESRFDTAADMQRAWGRVFGGQEGRESRTDHGTAVADLDLSAVTSRTLIAELALSAKVRDAVERLGVTTVADLVAKPGGELVPIAGIGAATRAEVKHLARRLRERLSDTGGTVGSIDFVAGKLIPKPPADEDHRTVARILLGLVDVPALPEWPSLRDVLDHAGLPPETVSGGIESARTRWQRLPEVTEARREIQALLAARGGIAGAGELAGLLLSSRGSSAGEPDRSTRARAVVRAAMETETTLQNPAFVGRRLGRELLVALDGTVTVEGDTATWDADLLAEAGARLGEAASGLVAKDPLPDREEVLRTLRDVEAPEGVPAMTDARLVRLAAAAAEGVAVSTQLALYPRGMPASRAVRESRSVLLNRRGLDEQAVRERVRTRFPEAEPLPRRPALDDLLRPVGLEWDDDTRAFRLPSRSGVISTLTSHRRTTLATTPPDEVEVEVRGLNERLEVIVESGGFLALSVDQARLDRAVVAVTRFTGATRIDLDHQLVRRLRGLIEATPGGNWSRVLEADALPQERGWTRLLQVVRRVLPEMEAEVLRSEGTVVLTGLGLLARYDHLGLIERLRDSVTIRAGGGPLTGVVVVVPSPGGSVRPTIDGKPIPVVTANQWGRLTAAWLRHRQEVDAA